MGIAGGRGESQRRGGLVRLAAVGKLFLIPVDDVAVAVRLYGLELDLVLLRQRAGRKDELLELAGGDSDAGVGGPRHGLGDQRGGVLLHDAVQPGIGSVRADLRSGSATVSLVVEAVSDSVGTRNVRTEYPPCAAPGATTLTCAEAIPAASSTALPVATVVTTAREIRVFFMSGSVLLVW